MFQIHQYFMAELLWTYGKFVHQVVFTIPNPCQNTNHIHENCDYNPNKAISDRIKRLLIVIFQIDSNTNDWNDNKSWLWCDHQTFSESSLIKQKNCPYHYLISRWFKAIQSDITHHASKLYVFPSCPSSSAIKRSIIRGIMKV